MLLSLQAEVLGRLGRTEEAVASARTAYEEARNGLHRDILLRPHFDVITERLAALLHQAGEGAEAARVEAGLAGLRIRDP